MPNTPPLSPFDALSAGNSAFIECLYEDYRRDPNSVDPQWALFFAGFDLASPTAGPQPPSPTTTPTTAPATPAPGLAAVPSPIPPSTAPDRAADLPWDRRPADQSLPAPSAAPPSAALTAPDRAADLQVADLIHSYRELGHLIANLDPLGHNITRHPLLDLSEFGLAPADLDRTVLAPPTLGGRRCSLRELLAKLRATYCGTFAVEYMDIRDPEQRQWLQEQIEPTLNNPNLDSGTRKKLVERLIQAEDFELFLQRRFPTVKRFSNEGGDTLIPLLDELIDTGAHLGVEEILFGMAHRGRLNVLTHILRKPYEMMLSEVIGRPAVKTIGDGDVKYHLGYAHDYVTAAGKKVHLSLAANPSHLELIDPIVEGMCRAKQNRKGDLNRDRTLPVLIHGDAAFTGQGIVAETLNLSELEAYRTGGTIHLIINNQIGFTTNPSDGRFTRYPTDVAKTIQAPVFHVNADDPEAVVHAARLAMAFRQHFKADVIIDLVCYRRRGHNELDDASITQPVMAREIAAHPTVRELYAQRLLRAAVITQQELDSLAADLKQTLERALEYAQTYKPSDTPPPVHGPWANFTKLPKTYADWQFHTGVDKNTLKDIARRLCSVPDGFAIHPTVAKMMDQRLDSVQREHDINWGTGEMLALGSLLNDGVWIRLTGQDVSRGTFSHRNAVWYDNRSGRAHVPLAAFAEGKSRFMIINTMLSEFGVLGFEYGFSSADPDALVIWEAQFGDFVNMAQPILDQFLSSAESKWAKYSGIVLLLPHGYDGQGPEHSHARLERFLQLCAEDNMQVCYPTTPAQIFHLLRRQALRPFRKPLVVMSPKSMFRHKLAVSTLDEFAAAGFQDLIDETDASIEPRQGPPRPYLLRQTLLRTPRRTPQTPPRRRRHPPPRTNLPLPRRTPHRRRQSLLPQRRNRLGPGRTP